MTLESAQDPVPFLSPTDHARVFTRVLASPVLKGPLFVGPKR